MYPDKPENAARPDNNLNHARGIDTPVLFMTGRNNRVFADSNILCFNRLKELAPGNRHELLILDGYGHQDPFMGARVADEVFPQFLPRSEEHTSELQSLMRISYAVFCLKKKKQKTYTKIQ